MIAVLFYVPLLSKAQLFLPDSLVQAYQHASNDSARFFLNRQILQYYFNTNLDSALKYAETGLMIAKKNRMQLAEAAFSNTLADQLTNKGKYVAALKYFLVAFAIAEDPASEKENHWRLIKDKPIHYERLGILAGVHHNYKYLMERKKNSDPELFHTKETKRIAEENNGQYRVMTADHELGKIFIKLNKLDSAERLIKNAEKIAQKLNDKIYHCYTLSDVGFINLKKGNKDSALHYYHLGIDMAGSQNFLSGLTYGYLRVCNFYLADKQKDSALHYAKLFQQSYKAQGKVDRQGQDIGVVYDNLYRSYLRRDQVDSALKYSGLAIVAKDSISTDRLKNLAAFQNISLGEQIRLKKN